jgi:hypothetical protein
MKGPNLPRIFLASLLSLLAIGRADAQEKHRMVRMAKIVVDSNQLDAYKAALKEGIETAVRVEPGVLTLFAVYEKIALRMSRSSKSMPAKKPITRICKLLISKNTRRP